MTLEQFKSAWQHQQGEVLFRFSKQQLSKFNLKVETIDFLSTAGLPDSAAPFLSFVQPEGGEYNSICLLRGVYDFLDPEFDKYIFIGSDGNGNPIVVNTSENDSIEWLDHEDMFSSNYVNSSIIALAGCLLAQMDFIQTVNIENGAEAYLDANFTDGQFAKLVSDIIAADPHCLSENSFWQESLDCELAMREDNRSA